MPEELITVVAVSISFILYFINKFITQVLSLYGMFYSDRMGRNYDDRYLVHHGER